jgi:hypothetical protein
MHTILIYLTLIIERIVKKFTVPIMLRTFKDSRDFKQKRKEINCGDRKLLQSITNFVIWQRYYINDSKPFISCLDSLNTLGNFQKFEMGLCHFIICIGLFFRHGIKKVQ